MRSISKILIALLLILAAVLVALAWHSRESATVAPSPSPSPSGQASPQAVMVKVYFSKHPESDNDPSKTFALSRTAPDAGTGKFAVTQLLAGPTSAEAAAGYFTPGLVLSGASTCGADFKLAITGGRATLQFCRASSLKGVVADGQLESELKATLLQFPSVQKVEILNQAGNCLFDASGQNACKQ